MVQKAASRVAVHKTRERLRHALLKKWTAEELIKTESKAVAPGPGAVHYTADDKKRRADLVSDRMLTGAKVVKIPHALAAMLHDPSESNPCASAEAAALGRRMRA